MPTSNADRWAWLVWISGSRPVRAWHNHLVGLGLVPEGLVGFGGPGGPPVPASRQRPRWVLSRRRGALSGAGQAARERDTNKDGKPHRRRAAPGLPGRPRRPWRRRGGPGGRTRTQQPAEAATGQGRGEETDPGRFDAARSGRAYANVSVADGRLLRQLPSHRGPANRRARNVDGRVGPLVLARSAEDRREAYTHDIDPGRIAVARENFKRAGVENLVIITEGDAHQTARKNTDRSTFFSSMPIRKVMPTTSRSCCPWFGRGS